ncbi:hypothetical protein H310_02978 [Aphanomyces invadans]|uniref:Fanconi anemia group M protein n=1 Tax=Aphanomyces invadans TaxID=157072 RepID=A0A024UK80_9STRA|nr:hypothetical protein H310_02978 [Aphanomyces invadans]ETW06841.1 hypothetical protein H310_02978 [Aphanomyces invadans]|eukprot:XP_008864916.1 hypothetical protein H310_02978 [Aphanomyces invadans]
MGAEIDRDLATQWLYPSNYPVRAYQQSISRAALYQNTLVCLPTGLGKTLIAAVVMYNFHRWFPRGKIVFMAPTKPLVSQQIQACHDVMPIPQHDMAELQGNVAPSKRKALWATKRVFFCTPQSMQNDIERGNCDVRSFVCVVVDEAHRATGNYAYLTVIKAIAAKISGFRVLALSATPGAKFDVIQDVISNLRISHIECKNADDPDVRMYTHSRQEEIIRCKMNTEVTEVRTQYIKLFQPILHRLCSSQVLHIRDPEKLSRWIVITSRDKMRANPNGGRPYRTAEADLALLISLLHGKDILNVHGIGNFTAFLDKFTNENFSGPKKLVVESPEFAHLQALVHAQTGGGRAAANNPKLVQLQHVLSEHFTRHKQGGSSTRCIVFTQYRESVTEIVALLATMAPLIKVQQFIGQGTSKGKEGKGQTQKQQQEIVAKFRDGHFNVLVATCIAEEGLDIGEVDLIVSFDCLTSPVRMIQRMGRTGRKRVGRVVLLVTEGDEEKKLERSVSAAKSVNRSLTIFKDKFKCVPSARMVPRGITPRLTESSMTVPAFQAALIGGMKGAKKGAVDSTDDWRLNEDENHVLHLKHLGHFKRPTHLFSLLLPLPLNDYSKPHHFGKSRRSRCLLQLMHRVQENHRMTNAEFADRFRQAQVAQRPPHSSNVVGDSSTRQGHDGDEDRERVSDERNQSSTHQDNDKGILEQSFPLSYDDGVVMSMEPATWPPIAPNGNVPDTPTRAIGNAPDKAASDDVIEILSSLEDKCSPDVDDKNARRQDRETPCDHNPPSATAPVVFSLFSRDRATADASPPPKLPPKSKQHGSKAKANGVPSIKGKTSPKMDLSPHPQSKNEVGRERDAVPDVACVLMSTSVTKPRQVKSPMSFALNTSVGIMQQGEQVIAMLEHLSALEMSATTTHDDGQPTPTTRIPSSPPTVPSLGQPRLPLPRLFDAAKPLPCRPHNQDTLVVPNAPTKASQGPAPVSTRSNQLASAQHENSSELVDSHDAQVSLDAPTAKHDGRDIESNFTTNSLDSEHDEESPPLKALHAIPGPNVMSNGLRKSCPAKKSLQRSFSMDTDHPLTNPVVISTVKSVPDSPAALETRINLQEPPKVTKLPSGTPTRGVAMAPSIRASPGAGVQPHGATSASTSNVMTFSKRMPSHRSLNGMPIEDDAFVSATAATPSPHGRQRAIQSLEARRHPGTPLQDDCQVCGDDEATDADPILFCDGCNVAVHQHCYGVAAIPPHDWFCDACQDKTKPTKCVLCPVLKGALKQTLCKQWVHVQCFLWIPELAVRMQQGGGIGLGSLETLDAERFALKCEVCRTAHGFGIVQCAHRSCLKAFHVSCASSAKYQLIQAEGVESAQFLVYCPIHMSKREAVTSSRILSPNDGMFDTPGSDHRPRKLRKRLRTAGDKRSCPSAKRRLKTPTASKQLLSHYIEMEAEADEDHSADEDDEDGQGIDSSFIDDGSPSQLLSPDSMQAIYRRRESTSPSLLLRHVPTNGVVAACLQANGVDMDSSVDLGEVLHHGITCMECQLNPIEGVRYKCQRCPSFNLCMCCYSAREDFHPRDHIFLALETSSQTSPSPTQPPPQRGTAPIPAPQQPTGQLQPPTPSLIHPQSAFSPSVRDAGAREARLPVFPSPTTAPVAPTAKLHATNAAELTADQVERMEESRRKALELKRKRLEDSRRNQPTPHVLPPTSTARSSATSMATPLGPGTTMPEEARPIHPMPSLAPPRIPSPVESAAEGVADMPSFNLLPTFHSNAMARLPYSIAYHPRTRSSPLLVDVFHHDALPKVAEASLECDLLLSARRPVQILSFTEFTRQLHLSHCPDLNILTAFGSLTYFVHSSPQAPPPQECAAYAAKHVGMNIQWIKDRGHTLRQVLELSSQDAREGHGLSQYDGGIGKDPFYMARWNLFHAVPDLPFGGQQALTTRFTNMPVDNLVRMNTRFNPMHWKRMLPWLPDFIAHSIHDYLSKL